MQLALIVSWFAFVSRPPSTGNGRMERERSPTMCWPSRLSVSRPWFREELPLTYASTLSPRLGASTNRMESTLKVSQEFIAEKHFRHLVGIPVR